MTSLYGGSPFFLREWEENLGITWDKQPPGSKILPRTFLFLFFPNGKADIQKLTNKLWKEWEGKTEQMQEKLLDKKSACPQLVEIQGYEMGQFLFTAAMSERGSPGAVAAIETGAAERARQNRQSHFHRLQGNPTWIWKPKPNESQCSL